MRRLAIGWIGLLLVPSALHAQINATTSGPPLLPNYERVPVGEREALEAGAYIARTSDPNANWYNPAGLALIERTGANLSASAYEATTIEVASLKQKTNSLRLSPLGAFFGLGIAEPLTSSPNLRFGFFIARPIAWQTGTLDEQASVNPQTVFGVTSDVTLTRMEPGVAIGVRVNDRFRLGGSLGVSTTTLDLSQDIMLSYADADSSSNTRRTLAAVGTSWHLVPKIGLQYDISDRWRAGLVASAPGIQMMGSTRVSLKISSYASEDRYRDINFRDEEADFEYRLPYFAGLGIAWTYSRGSIEGTVRHYGGSDEYDMVSTEVLGQRVDAIGGSPPAITAVTVSPITNSWAEVTNFALGGNYEFSNTLRFHFGVHSDQSPVEDPATSIFRQVNLVGGTTGLSYQGTTFGASIGLGYSAGSSDPIPVFPGFSTNPVETEFKVSTFRATYSFSARF